MDLSNLTPAKGSIKKSKRIGRGEGSTRGGTSTKGHKGQKSRSGYSAKSGFEGGQMPLQRRVPKFGFRNVNHVSYTAINLDDLQSFIDKHKIKTFDLEAFRKLRVISESEKVKVLGRGKLKSKIDVKAHAFSKSAIAAIEKAGGKAEML